MFNKNDRQLINDENSAFCFTALSVIGNREDQQDSFGYHLKQDEGLVVVCDGMGGHEGGKTASDLAVETVLSQYANSKSADNQITMLIEAAKIADVAISQLKNSEGKPLNAGSTMVAVLINKKKLMWCSVGDSRAYLLRNGEMVQLTQDQNYHTVLIEKMQAGLLDEAEFRKEDEKGEALISFLGIGNLGLIDYSESSLELIKDDKIIVMSDGLYKIVTDDEILRILDNFSNIDEAIMTLDVKAEKSAKKSGEPRDNMTVALIKIK